MHTVGAGGDSLGMALGSAARAPPGTCYRRRLGPPPQTDGLRNPIRINI